GRRPAVGLADVVVVALDIALGQVDLPAERRRGVTRAGQRPGNAIIAVPLADRDRAEPLPEQLAADHETGVPLVARRHVEVGGLDTALARLLDDLDRAFEIGK